MKNQIINFLKKIPLIGNKIQHYYNMSDLITKMNKAQGSFDMGHYHSTLPDIDEIEEKKDIIFNKNKRIWEIDFNDQAQLELLRKITLHYKELPYDLKNNQIKVNHSDLRYRPQKAWYRYSDVIFLFGMLMENKPNQIIEIGSGYSSAIMLDVNNLFLNNESKLTFIEPNPERLYTLINDKDIQNVSIYKEKVQDVDINIFKKLNKNDILFIDSSHVCKIGSDLNHLLFEILPLLNSGVIIHFHDVFYPFEMPEKWVLEYKWFWNENYLLRAFLANNSNYSMIAFNSYLQIQYRDYFLKNLPECLIGEDETGSLWIEKK